MLVPDVFTIVPKSRGNPTVAFAPLLAVLRIGSGRRERYLINVSRRELKLK